MRNGFIILAIMIGGLLWLGGAFEPSQPKKPDAQYGDTIAANVATVGCDTEESHDKWHRLAREGDQDAALKAASRSCIAIKMGSTGRAIKTYGKASICVRWQGEPDCLWSPRSAPLFIPANASSK